MISVAEALEIVNQQAQPFPVEEVDLLLANGRVLAQPIVADRDFPPFHRATMDGVAISSEAFASGRRSFRIEAIQPAGHPQLKLNNPEHCIEIMTGAVLPAGADAVVRYEDLHLEKQTAHLNLNAVAPCQNVHLQGTDEKAGQLLISPEKKITPALVATMASVGVGRVKVYQLPRVAVCSTGDELVPVHQQPQPHQIRQSNNYMLLAALQQEGIMATHYHLPDEPQAMTSQLKQLREQYDVLLFSGAVSKGKFDFLPQVLQGLGMQTLFHSIAQKPGKPLLFGKLGNGALVFGFPGNPVSTWVCYQVYFRAWLYRSLGLPLSVYEVALGKAITFKPALTQHVLVKLIQNENSLVAMPVDTSTSGDMVSLMQAEGIMSLPANKEYFEQGSLFKVQLFA